MIVAGGMFGGVGLAFLIELYLDRTVKRPEEIETRLRLPVFLSIPDAGRNGVMNALGPRGGARLGLPSPSNGEEAGESSGIATAGQTEVAPWDAKHGLRAYYKRASHAWHPREQLQSAPPLLSRCFLPASLHWTVTADQVVRHPRRQCTHYTVPPRIGNAKKHRQAQSRFNLLWALYRPIQVKLNNES